MSARNYPQYKGFYWYRVATAISDLTSITIIFQNEEIEHAFYDSLWYLMDHSEKKDFLIMFHKCQHAKEMTVASMAPLNIVLFIAVSIT